MDRQSLSTYFFPRLLICRQGLASIAPDIPQLSEEDPPEWEVRRYWDRYWLIDPLDGTKEFISKNGEFTSCTSLISISR